MEENFFSFTTADGQAVTTNSVRALEIMTAAEREAALQWVNTKRAEGQSPIVLQDAIMFKGVASPAEVAAFSNSPKLIGRILSIVSRQEGNDKVTQAGARVTFKEHPGEVFQVAVPKNFRAVFQGTPAGEPLFAEFSFVPAGVIRPFNPNGVLRGPLMDDFVKSGHAFCTCTLVPTVRLSSDKLMTVKELALKRAEDKMLEFSERKMAAIEEAAIAKERDFVDALEKAAKAPTEGLSAEQLAEISALTGKSVASVAKAVGYTLSEAEA